MIFIHPSLGSYLLFVFSCTRHFFAPRPPKKKTIITFIYLEYIAILWIEGFQKSEVIVYGRKQGAPKGKPTNSKTR